MKRTKIFEKIQVLHDLHFPYAQKNFRKMAPEFKAGDGGTIVPPSCRLRSLRDLPAASFCGAADADELCTAHFSCVTVPAFVLFFRSCFHILPQAAGLADDFCTRLPLIVISSQREPCCTGRLRPGLWHIPVGRVHITVLINNRKIRKTGKVFPIFWKTRLTYPVFLGNKIGTS